MAGRVALFVPCYVDQLYPQVARATLELLERQGLTVEFPPGQTCCGQPMANAGCERDALETARGFVRTFVGYDYVVSPSGSCVHHVRHHYDVLDQTDEVREVRERVFELCQFLVEVLKVEDPGVAFPHRVGVHVGCHALRGLRAARSSELGGRPGGVMRALLERVQEIELVDLDRPDECCGFGGTFCVTEEAVSARMGLDRVTDHRLRGAEVITSGDMSCLMHLDGVIRRQHFPLRVMHVAEILNGTAV
ncbi:MAG: (Fe-S)-binding protein [Gemmatimonadales bacterium]|jgi:L-lactate dehydrogenase complex protein LldE|nr:(Fe-S)-binding protein [Gemmatimonadales bacterium]